MEKTKEASEGLKSKPKQTSLEAAAPRSRKRLWLIATIFGITILSVLAYGFTNSSFNGIIVDDLTGKPLMANVKTSGKTIQSNKQGEFALKGQPGQVRLTFSRKGYEAQKATFDVPFLVGKNIGKIKLKNGVITGEIKEDAVAPQTVATATISIGSKSVEANNGRYEIKGVPIGKHSLKVESPSREKFEQQVVVKGGENKVPIALSLTPEETLRRIVRARQFKDYNQQYEYANPDFKARNSKEDYIANNKKEDEEAAFEINSYTLGNTTIVPEWTDDETEKTYENILEIELTYTVKSPLLAIFGGSSEHTMHQKVHLIKVKGQWKNFPKK